MYRIQIEVAVRLQWPVTSKYKQKYSNAHKEPIKFVNHIASNFKPS